MSITTNAPTSSSTGSATQSQSGVSDKDFMDFLGGVLPGLASAGAQAIGIDPRVAGQTVSQVLSIFGIGKDFNTRIPQDQAVSQLQQVVAPHLGDPGFSKALGAWLQAAVEPIAAHKEGKAYQPSVDLSKNWFTDAIDTIGDTVSSVDWGQVAQVGMQALPFVLSVL